MIILRLLFINKTIHDPVKNRVVLEWIRQFRYFNIFVNVPKNPHLLIRFFILDRMFCSG